MREDISSFAVQEGIRASLGPGLRTLDPGLRSKKVAEEFASLLLFEVMKAMRATIPQEGLFGENSASRDLYTSLADVEVTRTLARRDGIGLGKFLGKALEGIDRQGKKSGGPYAPAVGVISSPFGPRVDPLEGERRFHEGVDIAAPAGSPVKAVAAGRVVFSGQAEGYGNLVTMEHGGGVVTRYAHNEVNLVSVGDLVVAGQEIALVGTSGRSTAPHLHFEVRKGGEPINPQAFLARQG